MTLDSDLSLLESGLLLYFFELLIALLRSTNLLKIKASHLAYDWHSHFIRTVLWLDCLPGLVQAKRIESCNDCPGAIALLLSVSLARVCIHLCQI